MKEMKEEKGYENVIVNLDNKNSLTRTHVWSGIQQALLVQPGYTYVFKGYIKLLNSVPGHQTHGIKLILQTTNSHGIVIIFDSRYKT